MLSKNACKLVRAEWQKIKTKIETLFIEQWNDPELPGLEINSSNRLSNWLEQNNFVVTRSPHQIPTAFIANSIKNNKNLPNIGIIAEFDALPSLDNDSSYKYKKTGKIAGHGCGHNHIGPANVGSAIAAKKALETLNLSGNICVIGCPAEEILWGKIALLKKGVFSNLDCILTSHGDYQNGSISRPCQSVVSGEFVFMGKSGHGGQINQNNSLLAAEKTIENIKKDIKAKYPNVLLRHIIRKAGIMPTITPNETRVWVNTRAFDFQEAKQAYNLIIDKAKSISLKDKISFNHQFISETKGYLPNDTLGREFFKVLKIIGAPKWTNKDLEYMEKLVENVSPGTKMTLDKSINYYDKNFDYFGQDDGEVSWHIPLARLNWAYPNEIPIHHWAWTSLSGNKASFAGPLMASETMALMIVNLVKNKSLIKESNNELSKKTQDIHLEMPNIGAFRTLTENPKSFWDGDWIE